MTLERPLGRHRRALARKDWYVIVSPPGREFDAAKRLRTMGVHAVVPSVEEYRGVNRYVREKRKKRYPCMPRYVLAGFDVYPPWLFILEHHTVTGVLASDGEPATVRYREIAHLIAQDPDSIVRHAGPERQHMRTHYEFELDEIVCVAEGNLAGFRFKAQRFDGDHTYGEIEVMGRPTPVRLPSRILRPLDAA